MSVSTFEYNGTTPFNYTRFVSETFANFLLENANNGDEILSVLDDIVEGADTYL